MSTQEMMMSMHPAEHVHPHAASASLVAPPVVRDTGHAALYCVTEALDLEASTHFLERARALSLNCRCLVVDLSRAEFVDSAGVRALLVLAEELEGADRELRLVVRSGSRVERTLGLLCLLERFNAFPSLKEAWTQQASLA